MEFIDSYPLRQVSDVPSPGRLYSTLMDLIVRFAHAGLIHGDFNEFNILIRRDTGEPVVIDFPQMVSTSHENAEWYFNRDVECIRRFFRRRFRYESALYPRFRKTLAETPDGDGFRLDVMVAASGFKQKDMKTLEEYMESVREEESGDRDGNDDLDASRDEEEGGEEEETEEGEDEETEREEQAEEVHTASPSSTTNDQESDVVLHTRDFSGDRTPSPSESQISRSPPRSRSGSVSSLQRKMSSLRVSHDGGVREVVSSQINKKHARQQKKFHSKKGVQRAGRPKGSKAKQDTRVKVDISSGWD